MRRHTVLVMITVGALAIVVYSISKVLPAVADVRAKSGIAGLVGLAESPALVWVKKDGGGKSSGKGKGDGSKSKSGGHGDGGGKAKGGGQKHGGKGQAKRDTGGDKSDAKHRDGGKHQAGRKDEHRDGDKHHKRRKSAIVYRDGHRYWHDRRIWWWGPLVYSYDPCIRWVRFCPDCAREPINICYYEDY